MKNFFASTTGMVADQQTYLTGELGHQMNYSTLSSFANLDYPKGIDSWLHRFEKPLSRVEEGTDRNPDVEHI